MTGLPADLAIDLAQGVPVIEATLDGHALRLAIDTGATWCMLTTDAAKRAGLDVQENEDLSARDAGGERRAVSAAHVERLDLPTGGKPASFGDFHVAVMDSVIADHAGLDGIIGLALLRRTVARFDFAEGTLGLANDALPEPDDQNVLHLRPTPAGLMGIDVIFAGEGQPSAGARRHLVIDTGFSGSIHFPRSAAAGLLEGSRLATPVSAQRHIASAASRDRHLGRTCSSAAIASSGRLPPSSQAMTPVAPPPSVTICWRGSPSPSISPAAAYGWRPIKMSCNPSRPAALKTVRRTRRKRTSASADFLDRA